MPTQPGMDSPVVALDLDLHSTDERAPVDLPGNPDDAPAAKSRYWILEDTHYATLVRVVALICISLGVLLRVVQFGSVPAGLNQDEASVGYDAWCLAHYGTEGNGVRWPVHLISWGDGGNASYAYMAMPFVAFGLSPFTLRLPMLIGSLASLFLVWFVARRLFDEKAAWGSAAVVALSPWHIMLSRWALDCNALPFLFLCGLALLVASINASRKFMWLLLACVMFGISVYSYGAAYLAVPLFVLGALTVCAAGGLFNKRQVLTGIAVFALTALPMGLYIFVGFFHWSSIHLAGITVPRLPRVPRFEKQLGAGLLPHIGQLLRLLVTQRDGTFYNVTDPYGVMYSSVFLALALSLIVAIPILVARRQWPLARLFIPLWIIACIPTGIVQEPNINRINLLLMGLIFTVGLALATLDKWVRGALVVGLVSLLILSAFFARDYFTIQRVRIAIAFFDGLLPALAYARSNTDANGNICVTGKVNMPQIYTLFSNPSDEPEYVKTVRYVWNGTERTGEVTSYGRYTFGLQRCDFERARTVVARHDENIPPRFIVASSYKLYDVYLLR